jgi:hypothetical protein
LSSIAEGEKLEKESALVQLGLETLFKANFQRIIKKIQQFQYENLLLNTTLLKFSNQKIELTLTPSLSVIK